MAAWPSDVNQVVIRGTLREVPMVGKVTFAPEVGIPKSRRRTSLVGVRMSWETRMTSAEWTSLLAFFRSTQADGSTTFTRNHPRTGVPSTFLFDGEPELSDAGKVTFFRVAIRVFFIK